MRSRNSRGPTTSAGRIARFGPAITLKALGTRTNSKRTPEQTEIARFWEATNPIVYLPIAYSVAEMPGRDPSATLVC
jgi:hypothetical protein